VTKSEKASETTEKANKNVDAEHVADAVAIGERK